MSVGSRIILIDLTPDFDGDRFARIHACDLYNRSNNVEIWRASSPNSTGDINPVVDELWGGWPRIVGGAAGSIYNDIVDEIFAFDKKVRSASADERTETDLIFCFIHAKPSDLALGSYITPEELNGINGHINDFRGTGDSQRRFSIRRVWLFLEGYHSKSERATAEEHIRSCSRQGSLSQSNKAVFLTNLRANYSPDIISARIAAVRVLIDMLRGWSRSDDLQKVIDDEGVKHFFNSEAVLLIIAPGEPDTQPIRFGATVKKSVLSGLTRDTTTNTDPIKTTLDEIVELIDEYTKLIEIPPPKYNWPQKFNKPKPFDYKAKQESTLLATNALSSIYELTTKELEFAQNPVFGESERVVAIASQQSDTARMDTRIRALIDQIGSGSDNGSAFYEEHLNQIDSVRLRLIESGESARHEIMATSEGSASGVAGARDWLEKVASTLEEKKEVDAAAAKVKSAVSKLTSKLSIALLISFVLLIYFLPRFLQLYFSTTNDITPTEKLINSLMYANQSEYWLVFGLLAAMYLMGSLWHMRKYIERYVRSIGLLRHKIDRLNERLTKIMSKANHRTKTARAVHWLNLTDHSLREMHAPEQRANLMMAVEELGRNAVVIKENSAGYSVGLPRQRLINALYSVPQNSEPSVMRIEFGTQRTQGISIPSSYYTRPTEIVVQSVSSEI